MKIKRFFSQDMRTVIRTVREELGPDAVILSNNRVNGGVEIIAAVDYDESLLTSKVQSTATNNKPDSKPHNKPEQLKLNESSPSGIAATRQTDNLRKATNNSSKPTVEVQLEQSRTDKPGQTNNTSFNIDEISRELAAVGKISADDVVHKSTGEPGAPKIDFYQSMRYQQETENRFYMLDDVTVDSQKVSDSLYNTAPQNNFNVWSQEPTLIAMRNEIGTLRGLLEQQLTGLAWGETERQNPLRAKLLRQLLELDLSPVLAKKIADTAVDKPDYPSAWQSAMAFMTNNLPIIDEDLVAGGGVLALVGPTGVGKTTSIVKLASRYALRYGKKNIGLITIDNFRVGAHEQLKTYAKIFDIPLRVATTSDNLSDCLNSMSDKHLIIIDTAGMSHRDVRIQKHLSLLENSTPVLKKLLVLPATSHRSVLEETVSVFRNFTLDGCILTKLDETTMLGGSLSVLLSFDLPVAYYCDGQKIPDALHTATAHSLVNRSVLIARKTNQPLDKESIEQAFTGLHTHAYI